MATTVYTGTVSSQKTLQANTSNTISVSLSLSSGNAIPAGAVVTSAKLTASKLYQYSSWRKFKVYKNSASGSAMSGSINPNGTAYDDSGKLQVTSNTWSLSAATSLYTGLTSVVFKSDATDDNEAIMAFVAGCVVTVTIEYKVLPVLDDTQPTDAKAVPGAMHTLSVVMTTPGSPDTYTYQWYKNGAAISGATAATLEVTSSATADTYYCVVTHELGTVTTRTVTIELLGAANIRIGGQDKLATPYIYSNDKWNVAVPYVHHNGAFKAAGTK